MFVRRFFISLPYGIVVHIRDRVWGPMVVHPLINRLGMVFTMLRA